MARCVHLARLGALYVAPNPMVGAVLVAADGRVIGEGWHERYGGPHAEVNCLSDAARQGVTEYSDCTLYVTLEPCSHYGKTPPCAQMLIDKHIGRVVVGMTDPNPLVAGKGISMLRDAGIAVETGVLEDECRALNKRFICLHEQHRPYITLKWAQTRDGYLDRLRAGRSEGGPMVISTPLTKQIVHRLRAENMAILVGSGTALLDNPKLTVTRWPGRNPIRVLLDRRGRVPKESLLFNDAAETIVYRERTDWPWVVEDMAKRGIHSVLVEGGAQVLNSILASGLWDEMHIEVGQQSLGEAGVPAPEVRLPLEPTCKIDGNLLYEITNTNR